MIIKDSYATKPTVPPKLLQESLLMPFAILKHIRNVSIEGCKLKSAEKQLKKAMKIPNPTPTDFLENAGKLKLEGNAAFKAGGFMLSIQKYHEAYEAMHTIIDGRTYAVLLDGYFATTPLEGKLAGQRGDLLRHKLGSQLNWNIVQAYIKLEDWEMAHFWGERVASDMMMMMMIIHSPMWHRPKDGPCGHIYGAIYRGEKTLRGDKNPVFQHSITDSLGPERIRTSMRTA